MDGQERGGHRRVKGQALFQTDGTRTFTKTDIHPAGENTYQYDVEEQFVFTL